MLRTLATLLAVAAVGFAALASAAAAGSPKLPARPCAMPAFPVPIAGQEVFVPVQHYCAMDEPPTPASWEVTVDFGDGTSATRAFSGTMFYAGAGHTYALPGTYTVTATIRDLATGETTSRQFPYIVRASETTPPVVVPPVADAPCPAVAPARPPGEGVKGFVFVGQHCVPAADRDPANFAVTVDFGDGTTGPGRIQAGTMIVGGDHAYRRAGTYAVRATVRDVRTGARAVLTGVAVIADAARAKAKLREPRFTVGRKGTLRPLVAFRDANPLARAGDYAARIAWGDGKRSRGTVRRGADGRFTVLGRHRYAKERHRRVTVTVTDRAGKKLVLRTRALVGRTFRTLPRR